jgi:hypothetical protein
MGTAAEPEVDAAKQLIQADTTPSNSNVEPEPCKS